MNGTDDLQARLAHIREKRGYLLPHHGLLATASPALLEAYDTVYSAFALTPGTTPRRDHEAVWIAVLTANEQPVATHHIARFKAEGGTDADVEALLALTALAAGFPCWRFVQRHWQEHLPALDVRDAWLGAFSRVAEPLPRRLAHLVAVAVLICREAWDGLAWQLVAAYEDEVPETELAETLALTLLPCGVPSLVEASRVWRTLILEDQVAASAGFRAWAETAGQGGYDEAAGILRTPP